MNAETIEQYPSALALPNVDDSILNSDVICIVEPSAEVRLIQSGLRMQREHKYPAADVFTTLQYNINQILAVDNTPRGRVAVHQLQEILSKWAANHSAAQLGYDLDM